MSIWYILIFPNFAKTARKTLLPTIWGYSCSRDCYAKTVFLLMKYTCITPLQMFKKMVRKQYNFLRNFEIWGEDCAKIVIILNIFCR